MAYEAVIGLEVHVQLATRTKLFCGDLAEFGAEPNRHTCPVCLGLPGALPVLNGHAVTLALRAALALDCRVHGTSIFARKNYFYPDLPKGYQITQFEAPLATAGWLEVPAAAADDDAPGPAEAAAAEPVRIRRIHLEEDAGKSLHDRVPRRTAIDLNRAGVPLIEIVTEPDLRSPADARRWLGGLKQILEYLEVSDCDMEKGSLRVDANISVRAAGSDRLGTKTEMKNMNSFANLERALAYEIERQTAVLAAGDAVAHETLLWDERRGAARPLRSKEESHDYRYFPDPDLPPLVVPAAEIEAARAALPELPAARARRFVHQHGLVPYAAEVLTASRALADYFEAVAAAAPDARAAANWVMTDVLGWLNQRQATVAAPPVPAGELGALIRLVADGTVSHTAARQVFSRMAETGRPAAAIVAEEGLLQVRDEDRLAAWADEVIAAHADEVARLRQGDDRLFGFLMGQLMKRSGGRADPRAATRLLRARLGP
jgi:aspartyl-tRNA(Asn)/glutamyl-tRNA(Gln) amidotransferase subunit B